MVWGKRLPSLSFRADVHEAKTKSALVVQFVGESLTNGKDHFYGRRGHVSLCTCPFFEQWSFGFDIHGGPHTDVVVVATRENTGWIQAGEFKP
jgi:hypothetical protein